ncbi:MAG: protein kinase domain-containing protein [Planctomycetaceae bacterium]
MALKLTVESFLQVVRQSGLIDKDQLQKLLQQYETRGIDVQKSQAIAEALVGDEVITRWQADKLLAGKHKGFSLGKYKLLDLLGKGGMSSVYLAEHVLMRRRCAIKVLPSKRVNDSSYLARFHREAQAVASVDHPNIVRAYDVDCAQDRDSQIHFLVMEYVTGQSLQELIVRGGPAEYADAIEYVRQAAEGLEHAHRAGLVHRDIKPANILIDPNGVIKILDMGLARFFDDRDENPLTVAHDEKVLGTADYLSPEQALDSHTVDARADIYSLGCTLYFFLTGHPPFTEGTLTQRLMWHQTKSFPPLTDSRIDCPASLMAILAKMVAKNPDDRFPSAADVATACRQWLFENAGDEWRQRHVPLAHSGADMRSASMTPSRDLQSDSVALTKGGSHVLESSAMSGDDPDAFPTKISRPGTAAAEQAPAPPTKLMVAPPVASPIPMAAPIAAPAAPAAAFPVAAPVVAMPVAPPMALPVAVPVPPIARPVLPVAMPIATPVAVAPVAVTPVAPTIPVAAPVVTPVAAITTPTALPAASVVETPDSLWESTAATEGTVIVPPAAAPVADDASDLFSLFAGRDEPSSAPAPIAATPVATPPVAAAQTVAMPVAAPEFNFSEPDASDPTMVFAPLPETVVIEPTADSQPESAATQPDSTIPASASNSATQTARPKNMVMYAAIAAATLSVIGGIAWWKTRETSADGKTVNKANPKNSKSPTKTVTPTRKQIDAHEVTFHVGAGGEFKSIGRALHSAAEGRAEHEAAAKGKPLRFLISVKPGAPFEESLTFDESFPGEVHLFSETAGKNFTLKSPGDEPAISIKNLNGVTIENVSIDLSGFPPKDTGISISGSVARCRINNCVISGAGKSGIELSGAVGGESSDGVSIDSIMFQNISPTASGVHIAKSANGSPSKHATVQRCRFIGSMAAAVFLEGPVDSLTIRNCGLSQTINGIRFAAGVIAKNVLVDHCSFRNQSEAGLYFEAMPGAGAGDLSWRNCLFAGVKKAELLVAKDYDANKFNALINAEKPADNNWSDRKVAKPIDGERDVLGKSGGRVPTIQFASVTPNSELYLVAKVSNPSEPYKSAGIKAK